MPDPSILSVTFLVLFTESLFFGTFCVLYLFSLWVLVYRQRRRRRSALSICMATIVTTMFLLSGLALALDLQHLMQAFVEHSGVPNGPSNFLNQQGSNPLHNVRPAVIAIITILGDGIMTYRIYVVWQRQWISLAIPFLLLAGDFVSAAFTAKALLHGSRPFYAVLTPSASPELIAYCAMTLLTNVVTTLLLLGRLWWYDSKVKNYRTRETSTSVHWQVMKTVIQSEIAYSIGMILNLVAFATHSNLAILTNAVLPSLLGISFTLIITRIGFSEMIGNGSNTHSAEAHAVQLNERGRALSPIAVDVFISRKDNGQAAESRCDKSGPACDGSLTEDRV